MQLSLMARCSPALLSLALPVPRSTSDTRVLPRCLKAAMAVVAFFSGTVASLDEPHSSVLVRGRQSSRSLRAKSLRKGLFGLLAKSR